MHASVHSHHHTNQYVFITKIIKQTNNRLHRCKPIMAFNLYAHKYWYSEALKKRNMHTNITNYSDPV